MGVSSPERQPQLSAKKALSCRDCLGMGGRLWLQPQGLSRDGGTGLGAAVGTVAGRRDSSGCSCSHAVTHPPKPPLHRHQALGTDGSVLLQGALAAA